MTKKSMKSAGAATVQAGATNYFSRKIGNTTFVVSVAFNEKATDSMDDKILRLVSRDIQQGQEVEQQCG